MKLEKDLIIDKFIKQRVSNAPFVIEAYSDNYLCRLVFDKESLAKYKIDVSEDLSERKAKIFLKSREMKKGPGICITDLTKDDLIIAKVEKKETQTRIGLGWEMEDKRPIINKFEKSGCFACFKTFDSGYGTETPCPNYKLNLKINEPEYEQLRRLP